MENQQFYVINNQHDIIGKINEYLTYKEDDVVQKIQCESDIIIDAQKGIVIFINGTYYYDWHSGSTSLGTNDSWGRRMVGTIELADCGFLIAEFLLRTTKTKRERSAIKKWIIKQQWAEEEEQWVDEIEEQLEEVK